MTESQSEVKEVKEKRKIINDSAFYIIEDLVHKLGLDARYIRERITGGELKGYKKGKRFYVFHDDLILYLKSGRDAKEAQENNPTKKNKPTNTPKAKK